VLIQQETETATASTTTPFYYSRIFFVVSRHADATSVLVTRLAGDKRNASPSARLLRSFIALIYEHVA